MSSMNFLQLVQRAYRELGQTGTAPSTVLNQTGRALDVVNWVLEAHEAIQNAQKDWTFDWAQGTFTLTSGQDVYDPATDFAVTGGVREFIRDGAYAYPTANGVNARLYLMYREWDLLRQGLTPVVPGIPTIFSLRPDGDVHYYPRPDRAITAVHEYYRNPEVMTANDSTPRMPAKFHMAIVYKAVMLGATRTKDWSRHDSAEERFYELDSPMQRECRPQMHVGGPLA